MRISTPQLRQEGDAVTVFAEFSTSEKKDILWFKMDAKYQQYVVTERGDAFVTGLLIYAMVHGDDIYIDCPISSKLYYNLTYYLIPAYLLSYPKLKPIKIVPQKLEETQINAVGAVGASFSGGVDSFCTVWDHCVNANCPAHYRLTHLAFFNVGSHGDYGGADARSLFYKRKERLQQYAEECEFPFIAIDSNMSEILQMRFMDAVGIRTMAPALLLQKLFRVYYFSSAYRIDAFRLTDEHDGYIAMLEASMLSTESLEFYAPGSQYTRVEKTAIVSKYEPSFRYLNVCTCGDNNCSSCFKCMRTLLTLEILGVLNSYAAVFDLAVYESRRSAYIGYVLADQADVSNREVYDAIAERSYHIPFLSRLHSYRYFCKAALKALNWS